MRYRNRHGNHRAEQRATPFVAAAGRPYQQGRVCLSVCLSVWGWGFIYAIHVFILIEKQFVLFFFLSFEYNKQWKVDLLQKKKLLTLSHGVIMLTGFSEFLFVLASLCVQIEYVTIHYIYFPILMLTSH